MTESAHIGMVGLAVMGRNLALNLLDHGVKVAGYNLEPELTERAVAESDGRLIGTDALEELVSRLEPPRKIWMMIRAGKPVDSVMAQLAPLLQPGDILIDGGNSFFEDTQRRERDYRKRGLRFVGMGVSGGEDGARNGPSLMPGGDRDAYDALRPLLEPIAAATDSGPCLTYCGPDGAGHFVKMVHNGIEYADMQFIAEAYHVLSAIGGLEPPALSEVFHEWNRGILESFLVEITAAIFSVRDPDGHGYLVDRVLDRAGQKGTGRWAVQVALEHGVAVPSIAAAVDARVLSSLKDDRLRASKLLSGPAERPATPVPGLVEKVHDALYAAKITAYAQGMDLITRLSATNEWAVDPSEIARIWKGGCIIRARFLDVIMDAYRSQPELGHLFLDQELRARVGSRQEPWREVVSLAHAHGIPVPGMASGLAYFDSYRSAHLPQNLTQAQRDAFGAHTYRRKDAPDGPDVHTDWLDD